MPHISVVANAVFKAHTGAVDSWTWSNDNSSCTADIYCTECGLSQLDIQADVTIEQDGDKTIYTATALVDGVTYTDTKEIIFYYVTAGSHDNGSFPEIDNIAKFRSGANAVFTCKPNEGFQLGNVTISNANERADVSLTAINGSGSGSSAGYSGNLVDSDVYTYWGITADPIIQLSLKPTRKSE